MFSIFDRPSVEDLLPILDFKNIKDPNELFLAHERLESKCWFFLFFLIAPWMYCFCSLFSYLLHFYFIDARKEIEKQLGIVPSESTLGSTKPRERRPGLPGFNRRYRPNTSSTV